MARGSVADVELDKQPKTKARAQRFVLQVPVRYRLTGEGKWRRGQTENISSSGVLFRAEALVKSNSPVEMCLIMPAVGPEGTAEMICQCVIVRAVHTKDVDGPPALAAKVLHFRLVRP